jgi:hypothetical protein
MDFCWKVLLPLSVLLLVVNGFFVVYEWKEELLALVNWIGAAALLAFIFQRGLRRRTGPSLVGAYKQAGAPIP